jgi:polysaccharide biosynthesis transport protein
METQQTFQVDDLLRMFRRRAWLVGFLAGGCFLAGVFIASILPNRYESYATLLVEPQTISERLVEAGLSTQSVAGRLHLIQMQILSRGRLSRIIDDLGLYAEESKTMTREEIIQMMRGQIRLVPVLPELDSQVASRQREVEINTFVLSFRHRSATTAADVTNRLASDFIDEHIRERVQISGDTSEFIEAELGRLAQRIAEVEDRMAAVKSENTGRLPEDFVGNQRMLERALEGIRSAERELSTARSDESFYRQQALLSGAVAGPAGNALTPAGRLEALSVSLGSLKSRGLTDKHPDVVAAEAEIAALRAQIASGANDAEGEEAGDAALSILQQSAQAEAQRAALRAEAAEAEIQRLRSQAGEMEARLAATPRVAERLAALEREHQHLFRSYQDFSSKRLEASVAANMERRQKGEQFRVLEAAFPAPSPVSPNRALIIVVGLLVGVALGGGLAVAMEATDSSFHHARNLQEAFRIPVLAAVPPVLLASDRTLRRRKNLRMAVLAGAVTGVVLVASVLGNWRVNGMPSSVQSLFGEEEQVAPEPPRGQAPADSPPAAGRS